MKNYILILSLLFLATASFAQRFQGSRLGAQIGVAVPLGDFSEADNPVDRSNGYATTGLDVTVFGDLFLTKHLSLGMRGGYTLYETQDTKLEEQVDRSQGDLVTIRTTPYQNLSLSGVFGYSRYIIKEKLDVNPYVGVGLSVFKTSDREITISDSTGIVLFNFDKTGELDPSFQITPGVAFHISLMSFLDLRLFGEYVYSDHKLTETSSTSRPNENSTTLVETRVVNYDLRSMNFGGGLSLRF